MSDSTMTQLSPSSSKLLKSMTMEERQFLRYMAEGFSPKGAATMSGLGLPDAEQLLREPKAQRTIQRVRRWLAFQFNRVSTATEAAKTVGVSQAYVLARMKAIEADPTTSAKDRLSALALMGAAVGLLGPKAGRTTSETDAPGATLSTSELAKLAAKNDTG